MTSWIPSGVAHQVYPSGEKGGQRAPEELGVAGARDLARRMHGQLGDPDVDRSDPQACRGDRADRGPAGEVGTVDPLLKRHVGELAPGYAAEGYAAEGSACEATPPLRACRGGCGGGTTATTTETLHPDVAAREICTFGGPAGAATPPDRPRRPRPGDSQAFSPGACWVRRMSSGDLPALSSRSTPSSRLDPLGAHAATSGNSCSQTLVAGIRKCCWKCSCVDGCST